MLANWRAGSREAEDRLLTAVQAELRRIAAGYLRRERAGHTLQPTAILNEAYMRLIAHRGVAWENREHFFAIASHMMRRVLVDHARRRSAAKRKDAREPLSVSALPDTPSPLDPVDVLDLHSALDDLARLDPRQAQVVELRYFAGLTVDEIAGCLQVSPATIKREWTTARVWLRRRLGDR